MYDRNFKTIQMVFTKGGNGTNFKTKGQESGLKFFLQMIYRSSIMLSRVFFAFNISDSNLLNWMEVCKSSLNFIF